MNGNCAKKRKSIKMFCPRLYLSRPFCIKHFPDMLFLGGHRYHLILLIVRIVTQRKWHLKKWKKLLISNYVELEKIVNKKVEIETCRFWRRVHSQTRNSRRGVWDERKIVEETQTQTILKTQLDEDESVTAEAHTNSIVIGD